MAQYSRESLLKLELYDKVNFVKLIKKVASYEEVNLIQKVLFGTSECLRNLSLSVALVTHKIFNFFLPNYLNPAHLISFSAYLVDNISFPLIRPSYVFNIFRNEMYFQQEAAVAQPVYL